MANDDIALLQEYAQRGSEAAFSTLVSRYINLVYSVALRKVGDRQLAEEVCQAVFILLARKARWLDANTVVAGWLCRSARFLAADALKAKRRRQQREQEAGLRSISSEPEPDIWKQIEPLFDDALGCLGQKEQDAVVLRFLESKDFKQVGAAMGLSEDAARMRVKRGLEKLRHYLVRHGVSASVAAIGGALAVQAIQAAPLGLAAAARAAALSGNASSAVLVLAAAQAGGWTMIQKSMVVLAAAASVAAGVYETHRASSAWRGVEGLQQEQTIHAQQLKQLGQRRDQLQRQLAQARQDHERLTQEQSELLRLRSELERAPRPHPTKGTSPSPSDAATQTAQALLRRVRLFKQRLAHWPGKQTPELVLLQPEDWFSEAARLEAEDDAACREAMAHLRNRAKIKFANLIKEALQGYSDAHDGQLPVEVGELAPWLAPPGDLLLNNYEIAKPGSVRPPRQPDSPEPGTWGLVEKGTFTAQGIAVRDGSNLSDPDYDQYMVIYRNGYYTYGK